MSEHAAGQGAEDALLVEDVREGRPGAFERLYARYARLVHGILLARVPRREAEDLVQDVFLTVHRRLHTLREARAFGGWLAMIARNRAMDHVRRRQEPVELPEDVAAGGGGSGTEAEAAEVFAAIRALPETYREPLILRLVEGMTGPEISERTGLTPGSVRVNLHRGMALLRQSLRRSPTHG
ncbi:MAG TPA: sigma-70 family RNA polymerase sigma factor [Thermoanaerobaculia bacterium]|nr:sigma-70 family RNA polymerase sigma factor [Thermoanaerobaculia bacterium]